MDVDKLGNGRDGHEMNYVSLDLVMNQVTVEFNIFSLLMECWILRYLNGRQVATI